MKTIFLAEREARVRDALRLRLALQSDCVIVGEASTSESLLAQVCQHPPDVILLDWCLPGLHPQRMLAAVRHCCPTTRILATSVKPEHESISLKLGVGVFLSKQLPPDEYMAALTSALHL